LSNRTIRTVEKSVIGVVDSDDESPNMVSTLCSISAPLKTDLKRGLFVRIGEPSSYFVAQIVGGPYFSSAKMNSSKARYTAEISSYIEAGAEKAVLTRPIPGAVVESAENTEVQQLLGISGDIRLGSLSTDRGFSVSLDLPTLTRHVGIFGTTGSGKSNSVQVLMEEASDLGVSVMVFDVEGEYVEMDRPTDHLVKELGTFGLKPSGVKDLKVYTPCSSSSMREDASSFGIKFSDVEKEVFSEVAGLNVIEQLYFRDLIAKVMAVIPESETITLASVIDRLAKRLIAQADNPTLPGIVAEAHATLFGKLGLVSNLGIVDAEAPTVEMKEIFKAGRVSVIDFSDASDYVRNIVIADLLDKTWKYKMKHPESSRLLIVIEEAHAFISKEKRDRMVATLMLLIETARRGRKRGLSLAIVTQQPTHLPTELLELCNTRIIHRVNSTANINVLKESTGNVTEEMWGTVTSLIRGEAIVSTPQYYSKALLAMMRPVASKRITTE
jgi:hypothetical protein